MSGTITALVETLVNAGATPEIILAAVRTAEASKDNALEISREKARNRIKKWRDKQADVTLQNVTQRSVADTKRLTRGEDSSSKKDITGKEEKKDAPVAHSDLDEFKAELSQLLDADHLTAIIKHRRAKRAQLTGLAARLFVADAKAAGLSVSDAVDTCISRNWITVKADWLTKRQPTATAPPEPRQPRNPGERALMKLKNGYSHEPASEPDRRLDEGDGRRQVEGPSILRRFAGPAIDITGTS